MSSTRAVRNVAVYTNTVVPAGARFAAYKIAIPAATENIDTRTDIRAVFLNPLLNKSVVTFGIAKDDEASNIPTSLIDTITATLAMIMKR